MPGELPVGILSGPRPAHGYSEPRVHLTVDLTGGSWAGGGGVCRLVVGWVGGWVGGWVFVVVVVFVGLFARTDWLTFCDFHLGFRQLPWVVVSHVCWPNAPAFSFSSFSYPCSSVQAWPAQTAGPCLLCP